MPERPKGADCKSAGYAYVGSNPTPSTLHLHFSRFLIAGVAQLVERQPSKLNVASSSLVSRSLYQFLVGAPTHEDLCQKPHAFLVGAPTHEDFGPRPSSPPSLWGFGFSDCGRSSPSCFLTRGRSRPRVRPAHLAQLVEHVLGKDEVISSILMVGSSGVRVPPQKLSIACACGVLRSAAA